MTENSILLVSRLDPLRYLFDRSVLTGRLMRWLVLLTEFDIQYVTQKSVKEALLQIIWLLFQYSMTDLLTMISLMSILFQ